MADATRTIAVLGSTGSIGRSTLEVVAASQGELQIVALSANQRLEQLCEQARRYLPRFVAATDVLAASRFDWSCLPSTTKLLTGQSGVEQIVALPEVDIVLSAVVASAGLTGTWAALEAGKTVALANKETLVMAGQQVMRLSAERGANILPVDSEHSAVFQLLDSQSRDPSSLRRIILTASGGPFRSWTQ